MKVLKSLVLAGAVVSGVGQAADPLAIHGGWVREMPPGTENTAAYFVAHNRSDTDRRIVSAETAVADKTELHTVKHADGVMSMVQIDGIDVPAHRTAEFEQGGKHLMLLGVAERLTEGQTVTVTLEYANGDTQSVEFPVKRGTPMGHGQKKKKHDH